MASSTRSGRLLVNTTVDRDVSSSSTEWKNTLSCEKCHSKGGAAADDDAGILAGQWTPYLKAQLADMLGGKRVPPEKMKPKIDALKPADVDALLGYYASQQ